MPHCGHGVGLSYHESPIVQPHSDDVLEEGMVISIEPILIEESKSFVVEDTMIIVDAGAMQITGKQNDLLIAGVPA
jgi:Xaa-Pro aminopeptidase/Xaa-Pro dipeptidase